MFKKIISRKVMTFFILHITYSIMYYFKPTDAIIWVMFVNGLAFISLNSIDKFGRIRENIKKITKE